MKSLRRRRVRLLAGGAAAALVGSAIAAWSIAGAAADSSRAQQPTPGGWLEYAPYFETWTSDKLPVIASESGARDLTLAFLQTPRRGSCAVAWNGVRSQEVKPGGRYTSQIAALRKMGGDVIPSFGGYSADQNGTEIADSCKSVPKIAAAYESVVTAYNVTRLDMDVEARSLNNKAGIARRSKAIAMLQQWAATNHRQLQIVFTLGVEPQGLPGNCLNILKSAVAHGVKITAVNIMAFDYYNSNRDSDMGTEAIESLNATHAQLAKLFPDLSPGQLWRMEGITLLPGIDDFPKRTEVTYPSEVQDVLYYARDHPISLITIWAIQRDNGHCPGAIDSNTCSGITQPRWDFSHLIESMTGPSPVAG
jgi:Glycosyl hydrolases family 18